MSDSQVICNNFNILFPRIETNSLKISLKIMGNAF